MSGANLPPALHELEAEVMDEVWRRGECSVREVMEALNARTRKPRAYTTYMTILVRLDGKRMVKRRRDRRADIYSPAISQAEYADLRAQVEVESLVDEFGDVALSHFARQMAE